MNQQNVVIIEFNILNSHQNLFSALRTAIQRNSAVSFRDMKDMHKLCLEWMEPAGDILQSS